MAVALNDLFIRIRVGLSASVAGHFACGTARVLGPGKNSRVITNAKTQPADAGWAVLARCVSRAQYWVTLATLPLPFCTVWAKFCQPPDWLWLTLLLQPSWLT